VEYSIKKTNKYKLAQFISLSCALLYLLYVVYWGELPYDESDGLLHFAISKQAWVDHDYFLNHWGKPLYILFSAPFAQFGFQAYTLFNVLLFLLTQLLLFGIFEHYKVRGIIPILSPILFLAIPDYAAGSISGLIEPFFGFLTAFMLWACIKEKWVLFALIASFTPFARSEGMLILVSAPFLLLIFKQWKALPFLLIGSVIYVIAGKVAIDQPFWYFENDPYAHVIAYGSGPWNAYITGFTDYGGYITLWLLPLMVIGFFMWKQLERKKAIFITLYFFGVFLTIIVIHSYFWAYGLKGSLGLMRIAVQGMPAALGLGLLFAGLALNQLHKVTNLFVAGLILWVAIGIIADFRLPVKESPFSKIIRESEEYVAHNEKKIRKIYYFHPLIAYHKGITSLQQHPKYIHRYFSIDDDAINLLETGDIIIRDGQFGNLEQGLPMNKLSKYPWIKPVKQYYTNGDLRMLSGEPESVVIYQVFPKEDSTLQTVKLQVQRLNGEQKTISSDSEFITIDEAFLLPALRGSRQILNIQYNKIENGENLYIVFSDNNGVSVSVPLDSAAGIAQLHFGTGKKKGILFIHNPTRKQFKLKIVPESWEQYHDIGIQPMRK